MTSSHRPPEDKKSSPPPIAPDEPTRITDTNEGVASSNGSPSGPVVLESSETVISKQPPAPSLKTPRPTNPFELGTVLEGTNLGHFQLEEFVGGGGMGAVFRAIDTMLGRTVAVKVLSRDQTDEDTRKRFRNEAQSAARLDHENIARVYYVGEDQGLNYIVFEFIEGVNIRDLVDHKGPLPLDEAVNYMLQVAEALEHASARDVVHRDIKPSNVLVTADGRAKLVDMGLARLHQMESDSQDLTASGVTLGTFDYISPEQARDPRVADVRSDLYSLGCTFYYMLTGRPPFPEGTVLQKLLSHSSEAPTDPRTYRPGLSDDVVVVIDRLLAKQPSHRYQRPSELIGTLLMLADQLDLSNVRRTGAVWVTRPNTALSMIERNLPWFVPSTILLLVVIVLSWIWQSDNNSSLASSRPILKPPVETPPPSEPIPEVNDGVPADPPADAPPDSDNPPSRPDLQEDPKNSIVTKKAEPGDTTNETPAEQPSSKSSEATGGTPKATKKPAPKRPASPIEPSIVSDDQPLEDLMPNTPDGAMPVVEEVYDYLVVAPAGTAAPAGAKVVTSLGSACQEAAAQQIEIVELHFDGELEERPFDIAADYITVRAGSGFTPSVVFRPLVEDNTTASGMIHISGGNVQWEGIHVRLELPIETAGGWTLFQLSNIGSLSFSDATATIKNVDADGNLKHDNVSFLEIENGLRHEDATNEPKLPPHIELSRSLLRGQATVLRAKKALPVRLVCQQSMLLTNQWMVEAGGTDVKPNPKDGRVDLVLKNVTAVLEKGLCRLQSDRRMPYQIDLVTDFKNCILFLTGDGAPLIERDGAATTAEVDKRLYVRGRDNFYPGSMTLLRINPSGDPSDFVDFDFEDRGQPWYQEESPRFAVMWKSLPALDKPIDEQTSSDYLLDNSPNNPARLGDGETPAGVDHSQLPDTPKSIDSATEDSDNTADKSTETAGQ